jgi:hypothetical protein
VSLYQTESVRQPFALDGVVTNDLSQRSLSVRQPDNASGYQRLWWKQAWLQMRAAVEDGWRNHPSVYASAPGARDVAIVHPGDFQTLTVSFPPGATAYSALIGRPGLYAIAVVDRNTSRFTGIKFLHRP